MKRVVATFARRQYRGAAARESDVLACQQTVVGGSIPASDPTCWLGSPIATGWAVAAGGYGMPSSDGCSCESVHDSRLERCACGGLGFIVMGEFFTAFPSTWRDSRP